MVMRLAVCVLTVLIYNVVAAQSIELKNILVEYYKNQNIKVELKKNVLMNSFKLMYAEDQKPTHIHLGIPKSEVKKETDIYFRKLIEAIKYKDKANEAKYIDSIRAVAPQCPFLLTMFGKEEKANYNYENSIQVFEKVLEDNPNDDIAYINLKSVLGNMGRQNNAIEALKMAILLNPLYDEYRSRNKRFLKNNGYKLQNRWFTPQWRHMNGNNWEIVSSAWEHFVKAYLVFSGYNDAKLFDLTKINEREVAIYYLAFEVLFHYKTLNKVENSVLNKIQRIQQKGHLIPFIASEVVPYFPENWDAWSPELIEKIKLYYSEYYFKKD